MSQGGKASSAGGATSAGAINIGGVPAGSAGVPVVGTPGGPSFGGTAGAPITCGAGGALASEAIFMGKSDFDNPGWTNSWFLTGCKSIDADGACTLATQCPNLGLMTEERYPVGGPPGQHFKVTFRFSAVVEAKEYSGGKRDAAADPADQYGGIWDSFYRDGVPLPTERNAWKLTVYDHNGQEARHYYMNAFPLNTDLVIEGNTFAVHYEKTIVVVGGGFVSHTIQIPACRAYDNCAPDLSGGGGEGGAGECVGARNLPAPDNTLMLPVGYQDAEVETIKTIRATVNLSVYANGSLSQPWHSQAGKLTVLSVECTNDPVSADYPDPF